MPPLKPAKLWCPTVVLRTNFYQSGRVAPTLDDKYYLIDSRKASVSARRHRSKPFTYSKEYDGVFSGCVCGQADRCAVFSVRLSFESHSDGSIQVVHGLTRLLLLAFG